jgi:hypothetical protein
MFGRSHLLHVGGRVAPCPMLGPVSRASTMARMTSCPASLYVSRSHRSAPSTPTRIQVGPAGAPGGYATLDPLLQHLDETLATYDRIN